MIRWKYNPNTDVDDRDSKTCCNNCKTDKERDLQEDNIDFVRQFNVFRQEMFQDLMDRKRAIQNWQKLRILLLLLKISGGRFKDKENLSLYKAQSTLLIDS